MSEGNQTRRHRADESKLPARPTAEGLTPFRIAVDTGGTFTDFVRIENGAIRVFKVPSTPRHPEQAILEGLGRARGWHEVIHGSTVATNALLERKGARTALVTTAGFEDVLAIGRQTRPDLYDISTRRRDPLVPRPLRFGLHQRILPDGSVEVPLDRRELAELADRLRRRRVASVAVSLLFSFEAPSEERLVREAFEHLGVPVSLSSEVLPEYREYERTSTTVANAWLAPVMESYLGRLDRDIGETAVGQATRPVLRVMQSNGGSVAAPVAMAQPVRTILSGPAGGVVGAFEVASRSGHPRIITFDMGGTSTDVALLDGGISMTRESVVDGIPIGVPMMDIHTVGAGGGSVASLDRGGALQVGPESAGADPGPICYGRGGTGFTVTDANVLLGRLQPRFFLGGQMPLASSRIRAELEQADWTSGWRTHAALAAGVIDVVNTEMEQAIRLISIERGHDARDFTLVCFGGAGGLHAAALARSLGIPRVLVPPHPGALSALGLLMADIRRDYAHSLLGHPRPSAAGFRRVFAALHAQGRRALGEEGFRRGEVVLSDDLDIRYLGQSFELTIPWGPDWEEAFHRAHERRYGYARPESAVEVVAARTTALGRTPRPRVEPARRRRRGLPAREHVRAWHDGRWSRVALYDRSNLGWGHVLEGPATVGEYSSTTWVPPDFRAEVDRYGNLILSRRGS